MPTTRDRKQSAGEEEARLAGFVAKFDAPTQRLIRRVRRVAREWFPTAHELVYDNYNFFVIGYSPTPRPSDTLVTIVAGANGVSLCFVRGAMLPDPDGLLQGAGNQTRFVRVPSARELTRPAIRTLIDETIARSRVPLSCTGGGSLVIRSVSAKQRPRRKAVVE